MLNYLLFLIYCLSFRWLIFEYKHTKPFRDLLKSLDSPIINELLECVYCQTIEASTVVFALLGQEISWENAIAILSNGFIALIIDGAIADLIAKTEDRHKTMD